MDWFLYDNGFHHEMRIAQNYAEIVSFHKISLPVY